MENKDKPAYPALDKCSEMGVDRGLELKHDGLTKREMFAMAAMQGMLSSGKYSEGIAYNPRLPFIAVEIADHLLEQLEI